MRIDVEWGRCEGHGLCTERAPQIFSFDDEGNLLYAFSEEDVPENLHADATASVSVCPVAALKIADKPV